MEANVKVSNLNIYLQSNFDISENLSNFTFYMEVLKSLKTLYDVDQNASRDNIKDQYIFYNKMLKIDNKLVYDDELFRAGLWRVSDLFESNGNIIPFSTWESRGVSKYKCMLWRGLLSKVKTFKIDMSNAETVDCKKIIMLPTEEIIDMQSICSKELYNKIIKLRIVRPTAITSYLKTFPCLDDREIENMYIVPRVCTKDNILKEFQYKILHRYLPTNDLLFKMDKISTRKCTFCNLYDESIIHVFHECLCVRNLWFCVQLALEKMNCNVRKLNCKDVILGYQLTNHRMLNICVNNVILHVKAYIWKCKLQEFVPSYSKLKEYIGSRKMLEMNLESFHDNM